MKKSLLASLIGIAFLAGTNAYAASGAVNINTSGPQLRYDNNGVDLQGNAIVSGDAKVTGGFVAEKDSRFESPVRFGKLNEEGSAPEGPQVTIVNGNVNASGNVSSGSGHSIDGNWAKIQDVDKRLSDVKKTSYRGIAAVTAIANIPTVEQGKRFSIGMGVGNFEGENALAIGAGVRANESLTFKLSVGKSGSSAAYGAGAALSF